MKTTLNTLLARPARLLALTTLVALSAGVLQTAQAGPGGHGGAGGPGLAMASPRHLDRMLDSVNATAEQRTQIQQILGTAREELKGQREQARTLRQQSAALFAQPTVDARAAEALRAQMVAQHDAASKRMLQAMLDVSRVLTPEQRQKMAERMQQRRSMMERHRGERQQLEGGRPL
jgi:Spy/CpxP family protein refolding chaperone